MRQAVGGMRQANHGEIAAGDFVPLTLRHAHQLKAKRHVRLRITPGQQLGMLEHQAAVKAATGHFLAARNYLATGCRFQTHDNSEHGRLAAAARPGNRDDFSLADVKADVVQGFDDGGFPAKSQGEILDYVAYF